MSLGYDRYVIVTKVKEWDKDVTEGKTYKVIDIDMDGCYILDDVGESQFMLWKQFKFIDCDIEEDGELNKFVFVKYFDKNLPKLVLTEKGDCIDLRVSKVFKVDTPPNEPSKVGEEVSFPHSYKKGDTLFFKLGVGMKLPIGYKANVYPRSSTFKNFGFILTNSVGIIDNTYCGDTDEWCGMVYCTRDGIIDYGDRIFQFEPVPVYTHEFVYTELENLDDISRGGYGTSGIK